jgi:hypothetical protein
MIKRYRKKLAATALTPFALLFALLSPATHAERFFRYVDENGKLVLSHTIPTIESNMVMKSWMSMHVSSS